jgi:hypothetical protein
MERYPINFLSNALVEELTKRFETEADIRFGRDCQKSRAKFAPALTSVLGKPAIIRATTSRAPK